jgi:hypothetical protein
MFDHPELYLLAPSSLTPTALREREDTIRTELTAAGGLDAVLGDEPALRVRHNFLYDAWLIREADAVNLVLSSPPRPAPPQADQAPAMATSR